MFKIENPYLNISSIIDESMSFHKLEYTRISRDFLESQLEEKVDMLSNHPLVSEIKAHAKLTEEDQIILDTNAFSYNYQKEKLEFYKTYLKVNNKYLDVVKQLKELIYEATNKLNSNQVILSKFTEEEIKKDSSLKKMTTFVPNGYDAAFAKFNQFDVELTKLYTAYISKNSEDLAEKLMVFLDESKKVRVQLSKMISNNLTPQQMIEEPKEEVKEVTENKDLFGTNRANYEFIKKTLMDSKEISAEQIQEIKTYLAMALTAEQLAEYNRLEQEALSQYDKINTTEGVTANRIKISLSEFRNGIDRMQDMEAETDGLSGFAVSVSNLIEKEVYQKDVELIKRDPAFINRLIGYAAGIKSLITRNTPVAKKFLFIKTGAKESPELLNVIDMHAKYISYLKNQIGIDASLLDNDLISTQITLDKVNELGYALMNNVSNVSDSVDVSDWTNTINKVLVNCIIEIITAVENGQSVTDVLYRYKAQYGPKEETKEDVVEEIKKESHKVSTRVTYFGRKSNDSEVKRIIQ